MPGSDVACQLVPDGPVPGVAKCAGSSDVPTWSAGSVARSWCRRRVEGDHLSVAAYKPTMVVTTWARPALRCERPCRYCPPRCEMGRGRAAESSIDDMAARGLLVGAARPDREDGTLTVWTRRRAPVTIRISRTPGHGARTSTTLSERPSKGGGRQRRGRCSACCQTFFRATEPWRGDECRLRTPAALRPRWPRSTSRAPRSRRAWFGGPCGRPDGFCEFSRRPVNSTRRRHRCAARTVRCRDDEAWMDRRHLPREGRCVIDARSSAQHARQGRSCAAGPCARTGVSVRVDGAMGRRDGRAVGRM